MNQLWRREEPWSLRDAGMLGTNPRPSGRWEAAIRKDRLGSKAPSQFMDGPAVEPCGPMRVRPVAN